MPRLATLTLAALAATSTVALAHSNTARESEQARWIEDGRQDGTITWREGVKLRREQREIERIEAGMKADGRLSRDEHRTLHKLQDRSQDHIVREASDGWKRWRWLPRVGR
jgi:hypothetical protein